MGRTGCFILFLFSYYKQEGTSDDKKNDAAVGAAKHAEVSITINGNGAIIGMNMGQLLALGILLASLLICLLLSFVIIKTDRFKTESLKAELDSQDLEQDIDSAPIKAVAMYTYDKKNTGKKCVYCDCENSKEAVRCQVCGQTLPEKGA